MTLIIFKTLEW